jgi:DNA-binding GntR family transcriptional regulator
MTVQHAWYVLREEGVIVSRQGSGVYVRRIPERHRDPLVELDELRDRVARLERLLAEHLPGWPADFAAH